MPRSETPGGQGRNDLIRDIGKSGASRGGFETCEHRLMRAAGDPLAVREILSEVDQAGPVPRMAAPLAGEAAITLARSIIMHGSLDHANWPQGRMRYDAREARPGDPSPPSAFAPSPKDREEALDLDSPSERSAGAWSVSDPHAVLGGLAVFAVLVWLTLVQWPD